MRSQRFALALCSIAALTAVGSCVAREEGAFLKQYEDDAGPIGPGLVDAGGALDATTDLPVGDPHAVLGVEPPHGPWSGGQLALVRGNGFKGSVRVWFGSAEIPAASVTPVDPKRVQVVVPPGAAGAVDVTTQNDDDESTKRTLIGGYTYDDFYAKPASGPTSGGTIITLYGSATKWSAGTTVLIDLQPCTDVSVTSPTELSCTTPAGTPGVKSVRVTTPDQVSVDVLDAFTYGDSDNGFKGGLSGQPLGSELKVLALDAYSGAPIPAATVVLGSDVSVGPVKQTDGKGVVVIQDPSLGPKRTVTVAKKCFQPITFVDVPVDTVTAYLDPVLSPKCASEGDPPPTGGSPSLSGAVTGQLIWKANKEFEKAGWTNVPPPKSTDEQLVAYVFRLVSDPTADFQLPSVTAAVTPDSPGSSGFSYSLSTGAGNVTLYALAGIENRKLSPPKFIAYAMGITKGVSTKPGQATSDVFIAMDVPLDQALSVNLQGPTATAKGPDRVHASTAIRVAEQGYAILPGQQKTQLLPVTAPLSFAGVPPLTGTLTGTQYVVSGKAVTGVSGAAPLSVAALLATTTTSTPLSLSGFVQIPSLTTPPTNGAWNGRDLTWGFLPGGASVDLTVIDLSSGVGLVHWLVAAPAGVTSITLPDLASLGPELGLIPGPVTIGVSGANIVDFDYGSLRYRQLDDRGWNAHATDVFYANL